MSCVENLPTTCTPAFTPAWAGVYQNVIMPSCGAAGTSCHGAEGKQGNLELSSSSGAYAALLGKDGTRARVIPNDPSCSILMERVMSTDDTKRMPQGLPALSAAKICAIQQWIEQGAAP
ncbi:MAG TPA: c-type cytochrome domain-containing protein [Polyangiales bacterium]|nr:c-type cytochrome domain-containing protein [Polyangiales bacterium]